VDGGGEQKMIAWRYLDKKFAVRKALRDYPDMAHVMDITPDAIKTAYDSMTAPRTPVISPAPAVRDPLAGENKLAAMLDEMDVVRERYREAVDFMGWFEPAWKLLNDEERMLLNEFYMVGSLKSGATDRLHNRIGYSRQHVERLRGRAFSRLTILLYGTDK